MRDKSNSISTQRNSTLSNINQPGYFDPSGDGKAREKAESSSRDRRKNNGSGSKVAGEADGGVLNGFLFLVNKASAFWAKKFNHQTETPQPPLEEASLNEKSQSYSHSLNTETVPHSDTKNSEEMNLCLEA